MGPTIIADGFLLKIFFKVFFIIFLNKTNNIQSLQEQVYYFATVHNHVLY